MDGFAPVEFKVLFLEEFWTLEGDSLEQFLNSLGADGWNLVHTQEQFWVFSRS
jgi:hypothetical protein